MRLVVLSGAYIILWWMALFVLLPIRLHNEDDPPGEFTLGAEPKPPFEKHKTHLPLKLPGDTVIACVMWRIFYSWMVIGVIRF